jgi:heme/copper-type cytochrome/quinol oxidase subunit 1
LRKKEIFWLIGTTILVLILNTLIFGFDGLKTDSTLDINVHDTYFVIPNYHFLLLIGISIYFVIYLIRALRRNFKNLTANLILIIATILLSIVIGGISTIVDNFAQLFSGWSIYPPLSAGEGMEHVEQEIKPKENNFGILSTVLFYTQILLLIFLAYCGFKTGRNYERTE